MVVITTAESQYYRKWYDLISPKQPETLITHLKLQGLWYPPDVCNTVSKDICKTIHEMVDISHQTGNETGAELCRSDTTGQIITSGIVQGGEFGVDIPANTCPTGHTPLGSLHTHPPYQELAGIPNHFPSPTDLEAELHAGTQSACIISQPSGLGQCYTIRAGKAQADAYSLAQAMAVDLEYKGRVSPETRDHVQTFINQFGCEFSCKK